MDTFRSFCMKKTYSDAWFFWSWDLQCDVYTVKLLQCATSVEHVRKKMKNTYMSTDYESEFFKY